MLSKFEIALATALVAATASGALAGSKHPARQAAPTAVRGNVVAPGSYAYRGYNAADLGYGAAYGGYSAYPGYNNYAGYNTYQGGYPYAGSYAAGSYAYPGYNALAAASPYGGYSPNSAYAAYAYFHPQAAYDAYDLATSIDRGEIYIYIQDKFFRDSH